MTVIGAALLGVNLQALLSSSALLKLSTGAVLETNLRLCFGSAALNAGGRQLRQVNNSVLTLWPSAATGSGLHWEKGSPFPAHPRCSLHDLPGSQKLPRQRLDLRNADCRV